MRFFRDEADGMLAAAPAWMSEILFWMVAAGLLLGFALVAGVWVALGRMRELQREAQRLRSLEGLEGLLGRLVSDRDDLNLRRIEHVLIDMRDTQRRLEEALLRAHEAPAPAEPNPRDVLLPVVARVDTLGERIVNRMLALGYDRVQIVTRSDKLLELSANDGDVLLEARRDGVLHKGRMLVRSGRLGDVEIHPSYSIFP